MKKVLILYYGGDGFNKESHRKNYELLYEMGMEQGIKFYRSSIAYFSKNKFKIAFTFENGTWLKTRNIKPDIIIDKCANDKGNVLSIKKEIANKIVIVNDIYFNLMLGNKFLTYVLFSKYVPKSFLAYNRKDLMDKAQFINSDKIVIKPDNSFGGQGVFILDKIAFKKINDKKIKYPIVVQEFIDSRSGLKKLAKGVHDLRIIFVNHKPIISYIREPVGNSLIANVSRGGTRRIIDLGSVPKKSMDKCRQMVNKLRIFKNVIYSIDFIFDKKGNPYVLEINSPPSFHIEDEKLLKLYYKEIIKLLNNI